MPKTCPFTKNTLLKYPDFNALSDDLKAYALDLFNEGRLNSTGNFKRVSNPFFVYRRERSLQITKEHRATYDSDTSRPSHLPQKEISMRIRDDWAGLSTEERKVYALKATSADEALRQEFQYYEYTPICDSWWNVLNANGKKRFFFETMVRISHVQVYNSPWPGYLVIQRWAQLQNNVDYVHQDKQVELSQLLSSNQPVATLRHATRGSASQSTSQSGSPRPHREAAHPYNAARVPNQPKPTTVPWYDQLLTDLVYLGPRAPGGPERLLELLIPQPQDAPMSVYIETELPLGVPLEVVNAIRIAEGPIPSNAMILWGYTKPKHTSTLLPPQKLAQHVLPNLSTSQQPALTYSPSAYSPVSSSSGVVGSHSPITPSQTEPANNAHDTSHSNWLWENFEVHDPSKDVLFSPIGSPQLLLDPIPMMSPNAAGTSIAGYHADVLVGDFHKNAPVDDSSVETGIDALLPWLSTLRPIQSDEANLAFLSMLSCDSNNQMSEEEQQLAMEYFNRTFQELAALPILQ